MMRVFFMSFAFFAKGISICVEAAEGTHDVRLAHTEPAIEPSGEGCGVRCLLRAVAAVSAPVVGRAYRAAARVRDWSKTWRSMGYHYANGPTQLALDAYAVRR